MKKLLIPFTALSPLFATDCEPIFYEIWRNHTWQGESFSGTGSDLPPTARIREEIPKLLQKYGCRTMVDAPCGDFHWMRFVDLPVDQYIGADVVLQIVQLNQIFFTDEQRSFLHLDITRDPVPKADLILCRDCLVHLSFDDIARAIHLFKLSGSKYLLTTSFCIDHETQNDPIGTGGWRPLNLQLPPFNFPEPVEILNEGYPVEGWMDKSLFLWRLEDLPDLAADPLP